MVIEARAAYTYKASHNYKTYKRSLYFFINNIFSKERASYVTQSNDNIYQDQSYRSRFLIRYCQHLPKEKFDYILVILYSYMFIFMYDILYE